MNYVFGLSVCACARSCVRTGGGILRPVCRRHLVIAYFSISACAFYRAMLCIRGTSHGPVSVSVCLSVSVCHMSEFY